METPTQIALVFAAQAGDRTAFDTLVKPYRRELLVHCYRMLGSLHDAEDLVQETLIQAWEKCATFTSPESYRAWLYRIATNLCLNTLTRVPRRSLPPSTHPQTDPTRPLPQRQGACGIGLWMCARRQRPSRYTGERIQAQIRGNAVQPGTVRFRTRECRAFLPCPDQCLLHEVFGVVYRAQHPIAMNEEFTPIRFHQGIESRPISRLSGEHQCDLGWSLHWGYLFLSSHIHLRLFLPPVQGKQFVHARLLPTDAHRFQESLSFLLLTL